MLKKSIGLGVVLGAGLVVSAMAGGCGTSSSGPTEVADTGTPAVDSGKKADATPMDVPDSPTGTPTCPVTVAMSDLPQGWKPPAAASSVCTSSDIAALKTALGDAQGTDATLKASVTNAPCNACIFSKSTDANWTPLVDYPDGMGGTQLIINQGACFAGAPNGTSMCGQAFFDIDNCLFGACPTTTCTDQQGCATAAQGTGGTCNSEETALQSGCGSAFKGLSTTCLGSAATLGDAILLQVEALCGGGAAADGGGNDGG